MESSYNNDVPICSGFSRAMCWAFLFAKGRVGSLRVFISGGNKNGKSYFAQELAKRAKQHAEPLYYVATMRAVDQEDDERIVRHRQEREGWGFTTIEQSRDIHNILHKCDHNASFLLDSLTALLANEMFPGGSLVREDASEYIAGGLLRLMEQLENIVIVSDFIYSDAALYDPLTERYREGLASLDRLVARHSDIVAEVVFSQIIVHKGTLEWLRQ